MNDSRALSFYVEDVLLLALACALAARDATQPWPAFGGIALPPPGAASLWLLTLLACAYLTRRGALGRARACRPRRARSALLGWLAARGMGRRAWRSCVVRDARQPAEDLHRCA